MFVWTGITKFWQACLNHAAKIRRIFFSQSPKRIAMQFCSKKVILSFSSFLQKNKKISIWTRRIQLWQPCQKNSRQNSENALLEFRKGRKVCALSQQSCFSPKCSSEHAQWIFGKPAVTLLTRIQKNFRNSKNVEDTIFWKNLFFFIKNDSLATDKAILTTVAKNFLWESTHLQLRFRKPRKKLWTFRKESNFPKNVPMYMYNAVVTTLPIFSRQNSEKILLDFRKRGKIDKPSKKFIRENLRLNMYNEFLTSLP